jgi:ectoine hydroxylase-related dioxygenase (phytanoyl-CoA dioxygenase family)
MRHRQFLDDGFALFPDVLADVECDRLSAALPSSGDPGSRDLLPQRWCVALAARIRAHAGIASLIPTNHVAVQCTYFEKSRATNWLVPVHQDLSIPVAERIEHPALSGWSDKEQGLYVQPPEDLLRELVAVRLHLDDCDVQDGPLRVIPGSHARGRIGADAAADVRAASREVVCTARRGAVMAMRPLLLHASSRSTGTGARRILHFLFGPRTLPFGLRWRHAV